MLFKSMETERCSVLTSQLYLVISQCFVHMHICIYKYDWKMSQQFGCHVNFQWKEITFYVFIENLWFASCIFFLVTQNMTAVVSKWLGQFSCICSKNDIQFKDQHKDFPHLLTPDLTFLLFLQHTNIVFLYSFFPWKSWCKITQMINDLNLHENAKLVEISIYVYTKQVSKTRDTKNIELDLLPEIFTMMMPPKLFSTAYANQYCYCFHKKFNKGMNQSVW